MRGQASLISTVLMIGVTLTVGIATIAYFNTYMATQAETIAIQNAVYDASSSLVSTLITRENNTAVFFITASSIEYFGVTVVGVNGPEFVELLPVRNYTIYFATNDDVDALGDTGWVSGDYVIVSGSMVIYDIATLAPLPVRAGVYPIHIHEPQAPVTFKVVLENVENVSAVRVYFLAKVSQKWYVINYYDIRLT